MKVTKNPYKLYASAKAVITQYLSLPGKNRINNIINRVEKLSEEEAVSSLKKVKEQFAGRHRYFEETLVDNFSRINSQYQKDLAHLSYTQQLLLGALFTKEYSIQSAALFNPSVVPHPDQSNLKPDEQRFIMSMRATGEGHISSIIFHTGIIEENGNILLDELSGYFTCLKKNDAAVYTKDFIKKRIAFFPDFDTALLDSLPEAFTVAEAINSVKTKEESSFKKTPHSSSLNQLAEILDSNYELENSSHLSINEKVIFPTSKGESMGIEDVRFVKFDDGDLFYYGTYTAYNGKEIKTQLIETKDFNVFKVRTLYGTAVNDKGMALFPEKVNGKYVMVSRQGGEKINIMFSDDLYRWDKFQLLMEPHFTWELLQVGNCGSPIKTEKGWLLLTHGVGAMRTYVISAILLDLLDPTKIIGRLNKPLIEADELEREGYVPNVVYTCGFIRHQNLLIIPYAVSDSATAFASIDINDVLNEMKN